MQGASRESRDAGGQPALLSVLHLSKSFGTQKALDDVHIEVYPGQVHALIGQNGSGKSTLLKVLTGFHRADPGAKVLVRGTAVPMTELPRHLTVRAVHQDLGMVPRMSGIDNVAFGAGYLRTPLGLIDRKRQREITKRLLIEVGLDPRKVNGPVSSLSMVERTMLAVARVMSGWDPQNAVLILDEPTSALPDQEAAQLHELVRRLRSRGVGVIYVSHSLGEITDVADYVTVLRDGRVVASAAVAGLSERDLLGMMLGQGRLTELDDLERRDRSRQEADGSSHEPTIRVQGAVGSQLTGLTLDVQGGEVLGVAGLAGSGHLELAYILGGAQRARSGSLLIDGKPLDLRRILPKHAIAAGVAFVPPDRATEGSIGLMDMTSNIVLPRVRRYRKAGLVSRRVERTHARSWIRKLDIRPADEQLRVSAMSGGNRQKVVLAKWMDMATQLLVLAEPTVGVDLGAKMQIYHTIRSLAERGLPVIVASTDNTDLVAVCDRVVCLSGGTVVEELRGEAITEHRIIHEISRAATRNIEPAACRSLT